MVTISNNADAISTVSTGRASAYAATSLTVSQLAGKSKKVEPAANFTDPVINGAPARSWGGFTFSQDSEDFRNAVNRSEEHTSELQSLMRISYAVFCLKKKTNTTVKNNTTVLKNSSLHT